MKTLLIAILSFIMTLNAHSEERVIVNVEQQRESLRIQIINQTSKPVPYRDSKDLYFFIEYNDGSKTTLKLKPQESNDEDSLVKIQMDFPRVAIDPKMSTTVVIELSEINQLPNSGKIAVGLDKDGTIISKFIPYQLPKS